MVVLSLEKTSKSTAVHAWFLVGQSTTKSQGPRCVPIQANRFSIGRGHDASLCLQSKTVSTNHAEILLTPDGHVNLVDLGSTNGTYVNGTRITGRVEVHAGDLIQFADVAMRLRLQGAHQDSCTLAEDVYDQALALVQLDKMMTDRAVTPYYQPIVEIKTRRVIGFEVLGRSRLLGVETPFAMFRAASKMNLEVPLSQMLRWEGIRQGERFARPQHLFVNTHPYELTDSSFIPSLHSLREAYPDNTLTLEIHEGAITEIPAMKNLLTVLNGLNISLAYDDFGAGQARLLELVEVKPDYLKFDMSLVRNIDQASSAHQQLVESLVKIAWDLGVTPLAEGVETEPQSDMCEQLGFELGQGFFYGRPGPIDCDA